MIDNTVVLNTLRPRQNGRHFADDIFKRIFLNENVWIPIKISLKFVPKGPINSIPALVQMMVWRRPGAKPLSEPMMVSLLTHICVTRPQWVNSSNATQILVLGKSQSRANAHYTVPWSHSGDTWLATCSIQKRNLHISVLNEALWDMKQVHSAICELVQFGSRTKLDAHSCINDNVSRGMFE